MENQSKCLRVDPPVPIEGCEAVLAAAPILLLPNLYISAPKPPPSGVATEVLCARAGEP